jgi:hypothetical protein
MKFGKLGYLLALTAILLSYQNCSQMDFAPADKLASKSKETPLDCPINDLGCRPPPLVKEPGVVTVLIAMGDKDNLPNPTVDQLSARVVSENMIQYASNVTNPKVLVVLDHNNQGESPEDFDNLYQVLLQRYNPDHILEPLAGLSAANISGYDVVWIVNPGHPMGSKTTHDTLLNFKGGVILSGDDMGVGQTFDNSDLTGLIYIDNGTQVTCAGTTYNIDNNTQQNYYSVSLDGSKFGSLGATHLSFNYGNDIDNTASGRADLEVLAWAKASPSACTALRPVVVRYPKK